MSHSVAGASLDALLDEIKFQRRQVDPEVVKFNLCHVLKCRKELRSFCQDPGFTIAHNTTYWTDLFVRHFLFQVSNVFTQPFSLFTQL